MFEVMMYDGGVYRSAELFEAIEDIGGTVLSDDFSILNLCTVMNIPNRAVGTKGIKKVEKWNYHCIGCGKWFKEKSEECPICGSAMRAHRKK